MNDTSTPGRCPACKKAVTQRQTDKAYPFCSSKCKMVDLGKWFSESYQIPTQDAASEDEMEFLRQHHTKDQSYH